MLGKLVRVCITDPVGSPLPNGNTFKLNHGKPMGNFKVSTPISGVLILGIDNPVRHFDGRVIAILKFRDNGEQKLIASPKSKRFINWEIDEKLKFYTEGRPYTLDCYYERSCGAVVYRKINDDYRYLLIRNRRSSNWSFPKGHVEAGETEEETAKREIKEETGVDVLLDTGFRETVTFSPRRDTSKTVVYFVAKALTQELIPQQEEISELRWIEIGQAIQCLTYDNDKQTVSKAKAFIALMK